MVLRIQNLTKRKKKTCLNPFGPDGKLCFPPKKTRLEIEEENKRKAKEAEKKRKQSEANVVPMMELLSGEYWVKREQEKMRKERLKQKRLERERAKALFDYKLE